MKFRVFLISRPHFDQKAIKQFLRSEKVVWKNRGRNEAEKLVQISGRVCYMSFGKAQSPRSNDEYIRHLIEMGHESVLEHANWTFILTGVSRAFTHQLVRHRVGFAFSQLSQQYHDETEAQYIEPGAFRHSPEARKAWRSAMNSSKAAYARILEALADVKNYRGLEGKELRRAIRSAARSVMPNATEAKIVMTANARAIRYFLRVRATIPGDEEMRRAGAAILKIMLKEAPAMFFDFSIETFRDGAPIVVWKNCGQSRT